MGRFMQQTPPLIISWNSFCTNVHLMKVDFIYNCPPPPIPFNHISPLFYKYIHVFMFTYFVCILYYLRARLGIYVAHSSPGFLIPEAPGIEVGFQATLASAATFLPAPLASPKIHLHKYIYIT